MVLFQIDNSLFSIWTFALNTYLLQENDHPPATEWDSPASWALHSSCPMTRPNPDPPNMKRGGALSQSWYRACTLWRCCGWLPRFLCRFVEWWSQREVRRRRGHLSILLWCCWLMLLQNLCKGSRTGDAFKSRCYDWEIFNHNKLCLLNSPFKNQCLKYFITIFFNTGSWSNKWWIFILYQSG